MIGQLMAKARLLVVLSAEGVCESCGLRNAEQVVILDNDPFHVCEGCVPSWAT